MPIEKAREMGAMALFGEKYGDKVRVVKYGSSVELCGGTHVPNTGNIGMVRIISESSIAAGIRRIEALTATGVEKMLDDLQDTMRDISSLFGNAPNVKAAVEKSIKENNELHKQVEDYLEERVRNMAERILVAADNKNGIKVTTLSGPHMPDMVKNIAFAIRKQSPEHTVFIGATEAGGKPLLTLMISDDLVKEGNNASQIIREAAKLIKGGGGGQPFFAQAGGKDSDGLSAASDRIRTLLGL